VVEDKLDTNQDLFRNAQPLLGFDQHSSKFTSSGVVR
jgi:hypothetical protein